MQLSAALWDSPGGVELEDLSVVHDLAVGARRMLLVLGYDVTALFYRYPSSETAWAWIDLTLFALRSSDDASTTPEADVVPWTGPTIALQIAPILDARDASVSMAIALPAGSEWYQSDPFLYFGFEDPEATTTDDWVIEQLESALGAFVTAAIAAGTERWGRGDLRAEAACGLLWLLDFAGWWEETGEPTLEANEIRKLGAQAHAALVAEDRFQQFLVEQASGVADKTKAHVPSLPDPSPATNLSKLLHWIEGEWGLSAEKSTVFFTAIDGWLRARGEEDLLPDGANDLFGLSWFEVLVTLVEHGVFAPAALGGSAAEEEQPVKAVRIDRLTVELTVWGHYTLRLSLVNDAGGEPLDERPDVMTDEQYEQALREPISEFTWDYLDATDDPNSMETLYIVAARGVEVSKPAEDPETWRVEIIRVENRSTVPAWGSGVDVGLLLAKYSLSYGDRIDEFSDEWIAIMEAGPLSVKTVGVYPQPDGVLIQYPGYEDGSGPPSLSVKITYSDPTSADDRYAFDVWYYEDSRHEDPVPYVSVWATEGITVEVYKRLEVFDLLYDPRLAATVWTAPASDIPPLGEPLCFDTDDIAPVDEGDSKFEGWAEGWEPAWLDADSPRSRGFDKRTNLAVTDWREPLFLLADLGIGFIPLVGDAVDVVELGKMIALGTDKWGRPVSNQDILIAAGAVFVPFASAALIKQGLGRVIVAFSSNAYPTLPLLIVDAENVELTTEALETALQAQAKQAAEWTSLARADRLKVIDELKRIIEPLSRSVGDQLAGEFFQLSDIIDDVGTGFRSPEVDRAYRQWIADLRFETDGAEPVLVTVANHEQAMKRFVTGCRNRRARVILQTLLGNAEVGTIGRGMRKPKVKDNYPSSSHITARTGPPTQQDLFLSLDDVDDEVKALIDARRALPGPEASFIGPIRIFGGDLAYSTVARATSAKYVTRVNKLLEKLRAGDFTLTLTHLKKIIGSKQMHPDELAQLLALSMDLLEHEAARYGRTVEHLLDVNGIEGFFLNVITGKGKENGTRFEVLIAAAELGETAAEDVLVMGAKLPGITNLTLREGPDFLRYTDDGADIIQGKSYADPDVLTEPVTADIPVVLQQLWSDLMRLKNTTPPFTFEPLPGETERVAFTGRVKFSIDLAHAFNSQRKLGSRKGIDRLQAEMVANAEGAADQFGAYLNAHRADLGLPDGLEIDLVIEVVG